MMVGRKKMGRRTRSPSAHGRGEIMRLKQIGAIFLVSFAMSWIGMGSVRAQGPSPSAPSSSGIPLEVAGGPAVYPSPQGLDYRGRGGNAALKALRNPFDGGVACPAGPGPAPPTPSGGPRA